MLEFPMRAVRAGVHLAHALLKLGLEKAPAPENPPSELMRRALQLQRICRALLNAFEVIPTGVGPLPKSGLLVSNHVSFLDIMVLGALHPVTFVSKSDVARWPVVGPIATGAGTLYVERERRSDVSRVNTALKRALDAELLVSLFPEGTTSDGTAVLPFRASLLQPAVELQTPVIPAHLSYTGIDGAPAEDIAYYGDRELPDCLKALGRRKRVYARVHFGEPRQPGDDRKKLAADLHADVLRLAH